MKKIFIDLQKEVCIKYGAHYLPSLDNQKVGLAKDINELKRPINGLRHQPFGDTTGWYIWAGTGPICSDTDYFQPIHVFHLPDWCPEAIPYLGLPPGWRFLIAPNYIDVWYDQNIINIG